MSGIRGVLGSCCRTSSLEATIFETAVGSSPPSPILVLGATGASPPIRTLHVATAAVGCNAVLALLGPHQSLANDR